MGRIFIFFMGALCVALGLAMDKFKCYWLIAGYNTASKEEQEKVDIKKLSRVMAILFYMIAGAIVIPALLEPYYPGISSGIGVIIPFLIIGTVIYCQRFDGNKRSKGENLGVAVILAIPIIISIVVLAGTTEKNKVVVSEDKVSIEGFYGTTINRKDITEVKILDTMPMIKKKSNGTSLGSYKKGSFTIEDGKVVNLYLEDKNGPYLKITSNNKDFYLNFKEDSREDIIYKELIK